MITTHLEPRLQKLVDLGESGTDILHGELKNLMYEAEKEYNAAVEQEKDLRRELHKGLERPQPPRAQEAEAPDSRR